MVNLSENMNPFFPNVRMKSSLLKSTELVTKYPSKFSDENAVNISEKFGCRKDNILVTSGSLEGIDLLVRAIAKKKSTIYYPTFWGYEHCLNKSSYKIFKKKMHQSRYYNVKQIYEDSKNVDLIILCNPNNPTLAYIGISKLEALIKGSPNCHFIIDETVMSYNNNYIEESAFKLVEKYKNISVVVSLSKVFGLPGLRLGLLFSNFHMIEKVKEMKLPYSVNGISEGFLLRELRMFPLSEKLYSHIVSNFQYLEKNLNRKYLEEVVYTDQSFILIKFKDDIDIKGLINHFERNNFFVRNIVEAYPNFIGNWIRVSAGKRRHFKKLINLIDSYCESGEFLC